MKISNFIPGRLLLSDHVLLAVLMAVLLAVLLAVLMAVLLAVLLAVLMAVLSAVLSAVLPVLMLQSHPQSQRSVAESALLYAATEAANIH